MPIVNGGTAILKAIPTSINFGNVTTGTSVSINLHLTNQSASLPILVTAISTSNPAFTFAVVGAALPRNLTPTQPSMDVTVTFTAGALGTVSGTLGVDADADNAPVIVPLTGTSVAAGVKSISINPSSWIFPETRVGNTSATQAFVITNTGTVNVVVQIPTFGTNFVGSSLPTGPTTLTPGGTLAFNAAFKPVGDGYVTDPNGITITSDAVSSPDHVQLQGNAVLINAAYIVVGGSENGFAAFGSFLQRFDSEDFRCETDAFAERVLQMAGQGYESTLSKIELQYEDIGNACIEVRDTNEREETKVQQVPIGIQSNRRVRQQQCDVKLTGELHTLRFTVVNGPLWMSGFTPRFVPAGETVKVPNLAGCTAPVPLVITSLCPVGPLTVGTAFTYTFTATGGTPPLTWSISAGSLPPGLTLSTAGVLSGTPTTTGTYPYTVEVTDTAGAMATLACSIQVVTSGPPPLTFTPCPGFSTVIGIAVNRNQLVQTETNFILPLEITDPRLKDAAHGGPVQNASAFDVRPSTTDCTMLSYELVDGSYNGTTGHILLHVVMPNVNGPAQTLHSLLQLNIGKASLTTDGTTTIWSGYQNVVHGNLVVGTPGTGGVNNTRESTTLAMAWNGSNVPGTAPAQMGNGFSCSPAQQPDLRRPETIAQPCVGFQPFTAEAWIKTSSTAYQYICGKVNFTACDVGATAAFWYMAINTNGHLHTIFRNQGWSVSVEVEGMIPIADGNLHHVKVTRSGGTVTLMVDGAVDTTVTTTSVEIIDGGGNMEIATIGFGHCGNYDNGIIQEIRTKNNQADTLNRTIDEYRAMKNVKNPSSFYILDPTSAS